MSFMDIRRVQADGVNIVEFNGEKLIVGHGQLAEFLVGEGYPVTKSTVSKYCSPSLNKGPPVHAYWQKRPLFVPSEAISWARNQYRTVEEVRAEAKNRSKLPASPVEVA
jgi:hypothetical protein